MHKSAFQNKSGEFKSITNYMENPYMVTQFYLKIECFKTRKSFLLLYAMQE